MCVVYGKLTFQKRKKRNMTKKGRKKTGPGKTFAEENFIIYKNDDQETDTGKKNTNNRDGRCRYTVHEKPKVFYMIIRSKNGIVPNRLIFE